MSQPTVVFAPTHEAASLIARLALHSSLPAFVLEEVRQLLSCYEPRRIAVCLAEAYGQLLVTDIGPTARQEVAYEQLLDGLLHLAGRPSIFYSRSQAA